MRLLCLSAILLSLSLSSPVQASKEIHEHKLLELDASTPVPEIALAVFRDETDGINLHIRTNRYELNSPNAKPHSNYLSGHAHLFVNGKKVQRVYAQYVHLPKDLFKQGINQIAVSLNSHQHENYTKKGQNIVGSVFIDFSKPELVVHDFSSQPMTDHSHHHH